MNDLALNQEADARLVRMEQVGLQQVVTEEQLRALRAALVSVLDAGDAAIALLREIAGSEPGPVAAEFLRMLLMGNGWFRAADHALLRFFKYADGVRKDAAARSEQARANAETDAEVAEAVRRLEKTMREQGRVR